MSHATMIAALNARNIVIDMEPSLAELSLVDIRRFVVRESRMDSAITRAVVGLSIAAEAHAQDEFHGSPVGLDLDLRIAFGG